MNELEHCRSVLLRVLEGVSNEQLDFQIFPDSKSIGELLLHVAGFEFLIISGLRLQDGHTVHHHLWHKLKPGFSREAGFPPPKGRSLDDYLEALAEVREHTIRYFGGMAERRMIPARFQIGAFVALLRDNDPESDIKQYDRIVAGLGNSVRDDGAENQRGETDLVNLLQLHETYHRGQITLQKYLCTRLQPGFRTVDEGAS
jgi:hypothetical protein